MAERRPEEYAARLIPWLEGNGQCSVMKLTDTLCYLSFPPESRLSALNGSFTLEFGEQGGSTCATRRRSVRNCRRARR